MSKLKTGECIMRIHDIGTQMIETKRLRLRQFRDRDARDMFNNWASDPEVTKYLTWETHKNIRTTKKVLKEWISYYVSPKFYLWAITMKDGDSPIGSINIHSTHTKMCGEIGYCLSRKCWNQGIMTEALVNVINYGFLKVGFERIQAYHEIGNTASGRVMQKAGMIYEGRLRRYCANSEGRLVDCDMYSIIGEDLKKQNGG